MEVEETYVGVENLIYTSHPFTKFGKPFRDPLLFNFDAEVVFFQPQRTRRAVRLTLNPGQTCVTNPSFSSRF
jgi:hypothetical protein